MNSSRKNKKGRASRAFQHFGNPSSESPYMKHPNPAWSPRPVPDQNDGNCSKEDFEIKPERPIINVFEVKANPILEILDIVAAADLPETGQARFHTQTPAISQIIKTPDFVHWQRARSDQAHLATQHIIKLGPFIEAEFAEEPAKSRDSRIFGKLEHGSAHFVHCCQLV